MTDHELHTLAQRLADGEAFPWDEALALTEALETARQEALALTDALEGDLAAACRVALAYDDRTGLEGLGYTVRC